MITAMITPFLCDGAIDIDGLKTNISFQIENGASGLLLLGTTGEAPTINHEERCEIIHSAAECINKRIPLMVGTGTNSTETTIQLTKEAYALGASSALIVTPYYNCPTQTGIIKHFEAIHDETKLPIYLYNHPKRTGTSLELETLIEIAKLPRIKGLKDCSGDLAFFKQAMEVLPSEFELYCGDDGLCLPAMELGAKGLISVASNLIPKEIAALIKLCTSQDFKQAESDFQTLSPLLDALFIETNPIPIKAAMELLHRPSGRCRLPLYTMSAENKELLSKALHHFGVLALQQQP
ncbi:MAG: 4-hydroxy-tetrahydrodipicolinate synthase [Chlamydiia bacterium]|nr:4-hydroxy-tetrahydrodipicolinate synthase [Chlamydiia bacterium]MCH9615329.1 4-hydroxy-tetrahydrodipicolinate synthase [Chlamydiia bacterium]MCH9628349.1 4-hydroxy-tetrahydrodipicolinate synthase [Chlamydiia bacterium]